jgi:hypothetical protein
MFKVSPASLQTFIDTRLTLTPFVFPNSNYVIMGSDWNYLKYFWVFLYCNHQVHRDFLIILYCVYKTDNSVTTSQPRFFLSNQQSQYSVFHELMCWHSLTFRLSNVMSPLQRGDLLYHVTGRMRALILNSSNYPDHGHHGDPHLSEKKSPW